MISHEAHIQVKKNSVPPPFQYLLYTLSVCFFKYAAFFKSFFFLTCLFLRLTFSNYLFYLFVYAIYLFICLFVCLFIYAIYLVLTALLSILYYFYRYLQYGFRKLFCTSVLKKIVS